MTDPDHSADRRRDEGMRGRERGSLRVTFRAAKGVGSQVRRLLQQGTRFVDVSMC
jgi:hypothetical protein